MKVFKFKVKQLEQYSETIIIEAINKTTATKLLAMELVKDPLEMRKNTFDKTITLVTLDGEKINID